MIQLRVLILFAMINLQAVAVTFEGLPRDGRADRMMAHRGKKHVQFNGRIRIEAWLDTKKQRRS